jgi:hypothetical protein
MSIAETRCSLRLGTTEHLQAKPVKRDNNIFQNTKGIERMLKTQANAAEQHSPLTTSRYIKKGTANKKHRQTSILLK